MKLNKVFLGALALLTSVMVGCNDNFDQPPMIVPQATHTANISIADFKAKYWQDPANYIDTVKEDLVIAGRVVSSDETGNIYKSLVIQDETAALAISINGTSLYNNYRVGQEIVLPLKDLYIGKYNSLQQLGYPQYYEQGGVWEATFMPLEMFEATAELNGLPAPLKVDTLVTNISDLDTSAEGLRYWQSRLVRFNNVKWVEADGKTTYSEAGASTNRTLVDASNNTIVVRNSNYASFQADPLPLGEGSVVGILSYYGTEYGTKTWQLLLRSTDDCIGFDTDTHGTKDNPYSIEKAIELQGTGRAAWVEGYIVGAVAPEVVTVSGNNDIEWTAPTVLATTVVIAPAPEVKEVSQCLVVNLPQDSYMRAHVNLKENPELLGTKLKVTGAFAQYMGMNGVNVATGSQSEFVAMATGGVTTIDENFEAGFPSDWFNVQVQGEKAWYTTSFDNNTYAAMTGYKGNPPFDSWMITPAIAIDKCGDKTLTFRTQVNGYGSTTTTMEVYVLSSADPKTAEMTKLNATFAVAPASGYSAWAQSGSVDLSGFTGTIFVGWRYKATSDANYATWCVDDVKINAGGTPGPGPGPEPEPVVVGTRADFESMPVSSKYGIATSAAGWVATNCNVLTGGDTDTNPTFMVIGKVPNTDKWAVAPCMNGKTSTVGSIVSPVIPGGCGTLKFDYCVPYTESNGASFRVDVIQGGLVVKTFEVTNARAAKLVKYSEELTVDVKGDFKLEFHNLSPSAQDANKDRVAIWNVEWNQVD